MVTPNRGTWSPELFARYRAATGALRRLLANQLLTQNEPLIKTMVAQCTGRAPGRRMGGLIGAELFEWDDAMQVGRIAFAKAIEDYKPEKAKSGGASISGYFLWKLRYAFQQRIGKETDVVCFSRDKEEKLRKDGAGSIRVAVDLHAWDDALAERLAPDQHGFVDPEEVGITADQLREWDETGEYPEYEEWQAGRRVISIPRPPLECFLSARCTIAAKSRVVIVEAWNAYQAYANDRGTGSMPRAVFVRQVTERVKGKPIMIRRGSYESARGMSGLRMHS